MPPLQSSHDADVNKRCGTVERLLHLSQLRLQDRHCDRQERIGGGGRAGKVHGVDRAHETSAGRSATPRKPQTEEADRALAAYGLYCQLCEALTGKPIAKMDELLTAAKKAKRELTANKGAGLRYEKEIARLKRMAAEKWEE